MRTTISGDCSHHHMSDYGDYDVVKIGHTLRQALRCLRIAGRYNYGDMGGMIVPLSDGTYLEIALQSATDNGLLLSSQRIARLDTNHTVIRYYTW